MSTKLYDISNWCKLGAEIEDYPYIGEIDIEVHISNVVKVNENYYSPGVINPGKQSAGVKLIELNLDPEEIDYENNLICPYCGYTDADSWELSDSDEEHECGKCGAIISYERTVTVLYSSSPKEPPQIVQANWK